MKKITLAFLAEHIGAELHGDGDQEVAGLNTLALANESQVGFLANKKYKSQLDDTQALAVIVAPAEHKNVQCGALVMDNPYLGYALAAQLFDDTPSRKPEIHPSAVIADSAIMGENVTIGPNVVIEANVTIGRDSVIDAGCFIGADAEIGKSVTMKPNATIYHKVVLGDKVMVHSNAVIGSDGFGFANDKGQWVKIPQLGRVVVGEGADIGASCSIDRGALGDTTIGKGVIIDNQCQVGHNCQIGDFTAIAGASGIAGSTNIGKYCIIGGAVTINGHIDICDGVHITGNSMIVKSITEPGLYSSGIPAVANREWRRGVNRYQKLGQLFERVKALESNLSEDNS
ncbi:UDP-3-O-(3-hydroxymyristoyl)glucosamine N-acyltransferase [Echinimonas agarilytica]|uniref:UDP-3-O-acylglucosamine N-acyltransferase n=1 Tax=Echinimonas agarilytica TaxID=1215918 RepID=A0AA42B6T8_9GAMM|nr:UDP-3-O-(3-hydroxymyristoyl)glucosamine N-acyltransferase [Echinimonas agarilytica]MCM2679134.1 UDP-3-O-(3-hydroxymyristoyl)glucosamine N-acyltransferase [Echinimonas agarilytica]